MEEITSNTTISVMMVYLSCHEEVYLGPKPKTKKRDIQAK